MNLVEMTWPEVSALSKDTPVVIPVAAIEQHGHHLPVVTDSLLLGEIVARVSARMAERVLFAPLQWLGNSHHHLDFAGTVSASPRVYLDLLNDLVECFLVHGFRRIVLVNGHGGNDIPAKQAIFEVRQRHRARSDLLLLMTTSCEWETSMVLRASPHLVKPHERLETVPFGNPFLPGSRGWITKERTVPGHIGSPQLATAAKGELLFSLFAADLEAWLERVLRWDGRSWEG